MRSVLGPLAASLRAGGKRRAVLVLLLLWIALLGLLSFGTFMDLRQQRRFFEIAVGGGEVPFGVDCRGETGDECRFMGPAGLPVGPTLSSSELFGTGAGPKVAPGPAEPGDDPFQRQLEAFERLRPQLEPELREQFRTLEGAYAPRRLLVARTRVVGTFWGVLFAVAFGATHIGAEWRWSVWRTLLTHEPRRGRVLAAKFGALWILMAAGIVLALAAVTGIDQILRVVLDVSARGGPGYVSLAVELARAVLPLQVYASIAAAGALIARTSIVGLGGPLALLLADGLLTNRFTQLRPFSAAQQIAWLIPRPETGTGPYAPMAWWPKITHRLDCAQAPVQRLGEFATSMCREVKLPPIPQWRALAVLVAWIAAFALAAYAALRARDVPQ